MISCFDLISISVANEVQRCFFLFPISIWIPISISVSAKSKHISDFVRDKVTARLGQVVPDTLKVCGSIHKTEEKILLSIGEVIKTPEI